MKWFLVIGLFVYYTELSAGSVIKAPSYGANDKASPITETKEKEYLNTEAFSTYEDVRIEVECLSGSEWESNCHSCRCSEEGRAVCSKIDICDKGSNGEPLRCKPQTSFKRDCNTCRCLDNGLVLCTLKGCPRSSIPKKQDLLPGKDCSPGTRWKSRCNECICSSEGLANCTKHDCSEKENEPEMDCAPDSVWKNDCNTCWCTSDGHAVCTRMGCSLHNVSDWNPQPVKPKNSTTVQPKIPPVSKSSDNSESVFRRKRATSQETPKTCQPGQEFRMDCNKCLCDNEGQDFSCTRIDCAAMNSNNGADRTKREVTSQVQLNCTPGSVFDQGCNVCQCTTDGNHAMCTMKRCHDESTDNDINSPESDPNFRCNPGEQFKRGCKDCTCSADGKSVFCTLRLCDQDINPTS